MPEPIVRERYVISWVCSLVATILSSAMLMQLIAAAFWGGLTWASRDAAWVATYFAVGVLVWAFPAVLSLTALASSEGRPRGRIGFGPLVITAVGFPAWVIMRLLALG